LIAPAIMAAILVPVTLIWIDAPAVRRDASGAQIHAVAGEWTRRRALRSWPFWSITLPFSLAWLAQADFSCIRSHSSSPCSPDRGGARVATRRRLR